MKKLLVLLMVLGLAPWANAGLIDVVMTGYDDNDGSGCITVSDVIYIAITLADGSTSDGYDLGLHIYGAGTLMEVDGGPNVNHQAGMGLWTYSGIADNSIAYMSEVAFAAFTGDLVWGLAIHQDGIGEVTVDLTLDGDTRVDGALITEADLGDLTFWEIPEPMMIALLGLGGMLLLRRRK